MGKLSNADRNRILARSLFVDSNYSHEKIAEVLGVTDKTVQNYQSKDKKEGFDWLTLRASKHITESKETKENMYSLFTQYMMDTLKEIRENEKLDAAAKAQAIVSLGDSFSKMNKIAAAEDPKAYTLGIVQYTVMTILKALKEQLPTACMDTVIETVASLEEELSNVGI